MTEEFCCDAFKEIVKMFDYPFYRPLVLNRETKDIELGNWGAKLLKKTPGGNISTKGGATMYLNYCPLCGKELREHRK